MSEFVGMFYLKGITAKLKKMIYHLDKLAPGRDTDRCWQWQYPSGFEDSGLNMLHGNAYSFMFYCANFLSYFTQVTGICPRATSYIRQGPA